MRPTQGCGWLCEAAGRHAGRHARQPDAQASIDPLPKGAADHQAGRSWRRCRYISTTCAGTGGAGRSRRGSRTGSALRGRACGIDKTPLLQPSPGLCSPQPRCLRGPQASRKWQRQPCGARPDPRAHHGCNASPRCQYHARSHACPVAQLHRPTHTSCRSAPAGTAAVDESPPSQ